MKKSILWLCKQVLRTAFFVWMAYFYLGPPGHALDFIPRWLAIGVALGLFWPLYWRLFLDVYGLVAYDIAARVEKRLPQNSTRSISNIRWTRDLRPWWT